MTKTFILGVGAQKGGTTWLHRQLNNNKNIDLGFRKEYHIFDAIEDFERDKRSKNTKNGFREKRINNILNSHQRGTLGRNLAKGRKKSRYTSLELAFIDNVDNYFDYFDYLYLKDPKVDAVGDITPNYALLQTKTYQLIRHGLEKRGFDVKVFFLMRDPVERAWSLARMKQRKMSDEKREQFDEFKYIEKTTNNGFTSYKSQYEKTIKQLEEAFDPVQIHYGFYENLFEADNYHRIKNFLDIPLKPFDSSQVFNASPKNSSLPAELNEKLVQHFKSTYDFIANRHGDNVVKLWQGYQYL